MIIKPRSVNCFWCSGTKYVIDKTKLVPCPHCKVFCSYCGDLGFETYMKNGQQLHSVCPECLNRERGVPIPYYDLGLPLPKMEKL